jgi:hypothetical protein
MARFKAIFQCEFEIDAENLAAAHAWALQRARDTTIFGIKAIRVSAGIIRPCRFCGCTEDDAFFLEDSETCSWADGELDVCTNPDCLAQLEVHHAAGKPQPEKV